MPPKPLKPRTIGLWGHYGGHNQGDDCTVAAIMQQLSRRCPGAQLRGYSLYPSDTEQRHGIPSTWLRFPEPPDARREAAKAAPGQRDWRTRRRTLYTPAPPDPQSAKERLRRGWPALFAALKMVKIVRGKTFAILAEPLRLFQSFRSLRGLEMLIVCGSQPLMDCWQGTWWHPYSTFRWALLARLRGIKVVYMSVGAGPLERPLACAMLRWALRGAHYISYRDEFSRALMERRGVSGEQYVFPDSVFGLDVGTVAGPAAHPAAGRRRLVVGLNPMAHEDPRYFPLGDIRRYESHIRKMADFAEWLIRHNCQVVMFYPDIFDTRACDEICDLLAQRPGLDLNEYVDRCPYGSFEDLIGRIRVCDVLLSGRFHGLIFSMLLHKPVLALAYNPKTVELMKSMGQAEFCLDIDDCEGAELIKLLERLEARRREISDALAAGVERNRSELNRQHEMLFGPLPAGTAAGAGASESPLEPAVRRGGETLQAHQG